MSSEPRPSIFAPPEIDVLIADDNFIVRAGMSAALQAADGIRVAGEARDGREAVALAQELLPDVALLDVRMPAMDGIEACRRISARVPNCRVLIVTWSDEPHHLTQAVLAGAKGYLLHGHFSPDELVEAVRTVHQGGGLITPAVVPALLRAVQEQLNFPGAPRSPLTEREVEVLHLIGDGHSNREIAVHLGLQEKTVKNHINNIYSKLHVQSRLEARMQAARLAR